MNVISILANRVIMSSPVMDARKVSVLIALRLLTATARDVTTATRGSVNNVMTHIMLSAIVMCVLPPLVMTVDKWSSAPCVR